MKDEFVLYKQHVCRLVCIYTVHAGIIPKHIELKYLIIESKILANLARHARRILTLCWHVLFPFII